MKAGVRYSEQPWPQLRNVVETFLKQHRPHTNWGLCEVDVTDALAKIRELQRELRVGVSFHAFILYCMAQATREHPGVLRYRYGRHLITFEDADVATAIDKRFPNGVRLPAGHTVRAAQNKSLAEINHELRLAIREDQGHVESVRLRRRLARMPGIVRHLVGWWMGRDPFLLRRYHGTIGLTSLQSAGFAQPFFALPPNIYTFTMAIGSTTERVRLDADGVPQTRKMLCLSAGADHLVIDGVALARFTQHMLQLIESGAGLDAGFAEQTRRLMQAGEA